MKIKMKRYFAIRTMFEDRESELARELRALWERYNEIAKFKRFDHSFPDSFEYISSNGQFYHIRGTDYCRGCSDSASCDIPKALVDAEDQDAWLENFARIKREEGELAKKLVQDKEEQKERALLASLQAKYGEQA